MTIGQMQQMKDELTTEVEDELLMKVVGISVLIIHDKFGSLMKREVDGQGREQRFVDEFQKMFRALSEERLTLDDIKDTLQEECGIKMIKVNDVRREWM